MPLPQKKKEGAEMAKLREKQQRFVEEYLIDLNGTQAAIRAGYSPKTANVQAARLLTNVSIKMEIDKAIAERSRRTGVTQDRVIDELAKLAFVKITDIVDKDVEIKEDVSDEDLACIESMKIKKYESDAGVSIEREVKIFSKLNALRDLGKHLGMFKDNVEISASEEQKNTLDNILKQLSGDA